MKIDKMKIDFQFACDNEKIDSLFIRNVDRNLIMINMKQDKVSL